MKYERHATQYPGVYWIEGTFKATGKPERIYYARYYRNGRRIEEKLGRQFQDRLTPGKAAVIRAKRIAGEPSNKARREAELALKQAQKGRMTLDRLWELYKSQRPKSKSISVDGGRYLKHISPNLGKKEPKDILPLDIDRLRIRLQKSYAPETVRHILELIRRLANFGVKKHLCEPIKFKIEMPKVDNTKTEMLTPEQLKLLMEVLNTTPHVQVANIMKMALFSGMRRSEIYRLKWEDIDLEKGFIRIVAPKGGKSISIPMNNAAQQLLQSIEKTASPYVFPGRGGKQRVGNYTYLNKIKEDAKLPENFRVLHGLRHVFASNLASSGQVDLYTIQRLLGHKSPLMTQRYSHLTDEAMRKASNLAGEIANDSNPEDEETTSGDPKQAAG